MKVKVINPSNEEVLGEYSPMDRAAQERVLAMADHRYRSWSREPLGLRLEHLKKLAIKMKAERQSLAESMHLEMGKAIVEALSEVDKCVLSCEVLVKRLPEWSASQILKDQGQWEVAHTPMGVILGIMPWNFPLWQVIRFVAPAISLGNTILLKHAPNVWGTSQKIAEIFNEVYPEGAYQDFSIDVEDVPQVVADPRVKGVSLTGSRRAGQSVYELCALNFKKCVLELGGSDAYVVFKDADLELAATICAKSRLQNAGQSCVSAKRFIVHEEVADKFIEMFSAKLQSADVAPLARLDLRDILNDQVESSVAKGARIKFGGKVPSRKGFFYPPTLLTNVQPGMPAFDDELFGPVAAVVVGKSDEELIRLANLSKYGLGGAIFSRDVERAYGFAKFDMEAGMVFVNDMVKSYVEVPFGGSKESGIGRELGRVGSLEFTETKTLFRP